MTSAETGIAWNTIPSSGASSAAQAAEQLTLCWRATDLIDGYCNQPMRATIDIEEETGPHLRLTVRPNGAARMLVSRWPILAIVGGKVTDGATFPPVWTDIAADQLLPEYTPLGYDGTVAPGAAGAGPSGILVAPGYVDWLAGRNGYRLQVTYTNGWPHTSLTAAATAGATTLDVDDTVGWTGVRGTIIDGTQTETVQVTAVSAASGPGTVTLSSGIGSEHASGVMLTALPYAIRWAAILLIVDMVRVRGGQAVTVPTVRGLTGNPAKSGGLSEQVQRMLAPYRRVL